MEYNSFVPRPLNTRPSTLTLIHLITCDTKYIMYMTVSVLAHNFLLHTPCRIVMSLESTISTIIFAGRKVSFTSKCFDKEVLHPY